jgi:hypothetical protein
LAFLALQRLAEDAEHVAEVTELDKTGADGEEKTESDKDYDQQFAPEEVIEEIEHGDSPDPVVVVGNQRSGQDGRAALLGGLRMFEQGKARGNFAGCT